MRKMREIKFRYKVKDRKELVYDSNEDFHYLANNRSVITFGMGGMLFVEDEQQYTGFIDKNKIDIYEGDIIKDKHNQIWEIIYDEGCFTGMGDDEYFHIWIIDTPEIIGNIHENPELIKNET